MGDTSTCPFCGQGWDADDGLCMLNDKHGTCVYCPSCNSRGPSGRNSDEALDKFAELVAQQGATPEEKIKKALDVIRQFGGIDGDHHKAWVLDQAVRALTGKKYAEWVKDARDGEDGPNTYDWDVGIPP
jgi:heterodisulfide reductase subunit C